MWVGGSSPSPSTFNTTTNTTTMGETFKFSLDTFEIEVCKGGKEPYTSVLLLPSATCLDIKQMLDTGAIDTHTRVVFWLFYFLRF